MKNKVFKSIITLLTAIVLTYCGSELDEKEIKLYPVKSGDLYQYIDREGKIFINPQFSEATFFRDGLALVKSSGSDPKWGYISEKGVFTIAPQYEEATVFSDGIAWTVKKDDVPTAIGMDGNVLFSVPSADYVYNFSEGLASFGFFDTVGTKMGFLDKKGKIIFSPQFAFTGYFSDGVCRVQSTENKWGYIDKTGRLVIKYLFDFATEFINGSAVVALNGKYGVIDKNGKFIINPQFEDVVVDGNKFLVKKSNKWGWCDKNGNFIINAQFDNALPYKRNSITAVSNNNDWGYIDETGKYIINPQFQRALPFNLGIAMIQLNGKLGFIDKSGKIVINPQFESYSEIMTNDFISPSESFNTVNSNFFNTAKIISVINIEKPEGFDFNSSVGSIAKKSNIKDFKFDISKTDHEVIQKKRLSKDATYSFWIIARASKIVPDGWYSKTVYDSSAKPTAFAFTIELPFADDKKADKLMREFVNKMSKYEVDSKLTTKDVRAYKNQNNLIRIYKNSQYALIVLVDKLN